MLWTEQEAMSPALHAYRSTLLTSSTNTNDNRYWTGYDLWPFTVNTLGRDVSKVRPSVMTNAVLRSM